MLGSIRSEHPWDDERAREWWTSHAPEVLASPANQEP
jgi:hypothetical protein